MQIIKPLLACALVPGLLASAQLFAQDVEWQLQDGFTGVGTGSPAAKLHIVDEVDASLRVENTGANTGTRVMYNMVNDGGIRFDLTDTSTGNNWVFQNQAGTFDITLAGTGTREFRFYPNGSLEIAGSYLQSSSRSIKHDIKPVDLQSVLAKVAALPIRQWSYNSEKGVRHMGPMSEDFYTSFGLGGTSRGITTVDAGGVALAAIKGLKLEKDAELARLTAEKDAQIAALGKELERLRSEQEERLAQLELALADALRVKSPPPELASADRQP
jgi:hypothetical protein